MISLPAKTREKTGKKNAGDILAVVYGPNMKNILLAVDEKEFKKIFRQAGESSLVELQIVAEGEPRQGRDGKKNLVLVHEIQKDPVSGKIIHVDFYQPDLTKEVEVAIPLIFEGAAPAEKDLGGTLNKNILEIEVKALPQNLPHEIKVDVSCLKKFEDHILVKDLILPQDVQVLKKLDEIVASVLPPQKIEEELAVPIEEKVEEVEKVEKEKKDEEIVAAEGEPRQRREEPKEKTAKAEK